MTEFRRTWPPLVLTLLALAVRLYNLTFHSLWFDEAMSVHWARSSVPRILEVSMNLVEDRLPPLYYLALHYWRLGAGDGEAALRLPSVLLGTLLVPLVYRLTIDLFGGLYGRRVALLAATLTAFNSFLIWYSQEARMYAQAVLLATLGTWFFLRATTLTCLQKGERTSHYPVIYWFVYGLCAVAGLYTHLYAGFLLPAHALYLLLTRNRSRRAWLPFALTMSGVILLFAPLGLAAWRASTEAGPGDPLTGIWTRSWWLLGAFSVWQAPLPPSLRSITIIVLAGFAIVGLLAPAPHTLGQSGSGGRRPPRPSLLIALLLLTPPAVATLLLFRNQVAFSGERYFIVSVPWLLIAVAGGGVNLAARVNSMPPATGQQPSTGRHPSSVTSYLLPATCYLLPIVFTLLPLPGQWSPPARKEAWRETADYLAAHAQPEDAILIHPEWTRYPLQYYFQGPGQTYAVFGSIQDDTDLDGPLTVISGTHPVVWLVESHTELADPDHRANAWLAARYPVVTELYPPGLAAVHAYAPGYISDHLPPETKPVSVLFQGELSLAGFAVPQTRIRARDDLFHPPSGWAHVALYWKTESVPTQDYTPFVHLVDDRGQIWGVSLERSNDAFNFYPSSRWQPGQVVRSDFDVNLNPITPPGHYTLVVGLRDASGAQVPLADDSPQAPLASVEVVK